jgi:hypothetical protein
MDWVKDNVTYRVEEDGEEQIMELDTLLEFEKQPFSVNLKFECDLPITVEELDIQCQGDNKHFTHRAIITRDIKLKPADSDIISQSESSH